MTKESTRYTVCVDCDGVLHAYTTPFDPKRIDEAPLPTAMEWLHRLIQEFDVVILTTRGRTWSGRRVVRRWIREHAGNLWYDAPGYLGLESLRVTDRKPPALVYIDDRAYRFDGTTIGPGFIRHCLVPWHKKKP